MRVHDGGLVRSAMCPLVDKELTPASRSSGVQLEPRSMLMTGYPGVVRGGMTPYRQRPHPPCLQCGVSDKVPGGVFIRHRWACPRRGRRSLTRSSIWPAPACCCTPCPAAPIGLVAAGFTLGAVADIRWRPGASDLRDLFSRRRSSARVYGRCVAPGCSPRASPGADVLLGRRRALERRDGHVTLGRIVPPGGAAD